jgi:hypothetical protein
MSQLDDTDEAGNSFCAQMPAAATKTLAHKPYVNPRRAFNPKRMLDPTRAVFYPTRALNPKTMYYPKIVLNPKGAFNLDRAFRWIHT